MKKFKQKLQFCQKKTLAERVSSARLWRKRKLLRSLWTYLETYRTNRSECPSYSASYQEGDWLASREWK